ncbi:CvpA family protein [Rapidithrix thailandica]|uniref:CvpA family protein n=1 Tax=Rapidithrix thailandica TaxID=413964 RepID=A0AAW9S1Q4_9BACT
MLLLNYLSSYIRVVDIVLAAIIIWGAYKGYQKGFLLELISTFVFVVGIVLMFYLVTTAFTTTENYLGVMPKSGAFFTYFMVFILGSMLLNHVGRILQQKIDYSVLDDFDNIAALLLGGAKYAIFLSLFIGLLDAVGLNLPDDIVKDSHIYPLLLSFQDWLIEVGSVMAPVIGETAERVHELLGGN